MPFASSMKRAYLLIEPGAGGSPRSASPTRRMFSRPSNATWIILLSKDDNRSHNGLIHPYCKFDIIAQYLANQITDLLRLRKTPTGSIADSPASFFLRFEFAVLEQMNQRRDKIGINNRLNLIEVTGCDIGYRPAGLFSNGFLRAREKAQQCRKSTAIDDNLSLNVIPSDNVAYRPKSRSLNLPLEALMDILLHCENA